jgi:hypothetical protein
MSMDWRVRSDLQSFENKCGIEIEINGHISGDFSTLYVRQKAWHGGIQPFLKTESGDRDIDLHPSIATMLKNFVGNRTAGFLFCSRNSRPLLLTNVLRLSLHPFSRN